MIDIETYLTLFKVGDVINIDEFGTKSSIRSVFFLQDPKANKWLKNTKPYYLRKVMFRINPKLNEYIDDISLDEVIKFNKDKIRDYKLDSIL